MRARPEGGEGGDCPPCIRTWGREFIPPPWTPIFWGGGSGPPIARRSTLVAPPSSLHPCRSAATPPALTAYACPPQFCVHL